MPETYKFLVKNVSPFGSLVGRKFPGLFLRHLIFEIPFEMQVFGWLNSSVFVGFIVGIAGRPLFVTWCVIMLFTAEDIFFVNKYIEVKKIWNDWFFIVFYSTKACKSRRKTFTFSVKNVWFLSRHVRTGGMFIYSNRSLV